MPVNNGDLVRLAADISEIRGLRVTVKECVKGGMLAGFSSIVGGLIVGPVGLAIGGIMASYVTQDFRTVHDVLLNDLTQSQQANLINRINRIICGLDVTDITLLLPLVLNNEHLANSVVAAVQDFVTGDLSLQLT